MPGPVLMRNQILKQLIVICMWPRRLSLRTETKQDLFTTSKPRCCSADPTLYQENLILSGLSATTTCTTSTPKLTFQIGETDLAIIASSTTDKEETWASFISPPHPISNEPGHLSIHPSTSATVSATTPYFLIPYTTTEQDPTLLYLNRTSNTMIIIR